MDLAEMVHEEARHVVAPGGAPAVHLRVASAVVPGNPDQLRRVVRNLLDNAVRHARTRMDITTQATDGRVVLHVDDDGVGIPPEDRERVFERFTRLDESRTRAHGGIGIGLAIMRRVVSGHRGTVRVTSSPQGGARFEVVLPVGGSDSATE